MKSFHAFIDVAYKGSKAYSAAIVTDSTKGDSISISHNYGVFINGVRPYEPGRFYKRELPCILKVLEKIHEPLGLIFIDGYTWLPDGRAGLGAHLFHAVDARSPVIGISKSAFRIKSRPRHCVGKILRGKSKRFLYVSAAGIQLDEAIEIVKTLPGPYRLPDPVRAVNQLCNTKLKKFIG